MKVKILIWVVILCLLFWIFMYNKNLEIQPISQELQQKDTSAPEIVAE